MYFRDWLATTRTRLAYWPIQMTDPRKHCATEASGPWTNFPTRAKQSTSPSAGQPRNAVRTSLEMVPSSSCAAGFPRSAKRTSDGRRGYSTGNCRKQNNKSWSQNKYTTRCNRAIAFAQGWQTRGHESPLPSHAHVKLDTLQQIQASPYSRHCS